MALLADFQALKTDQLQLATLNGTVATATTALANANAAVAAQDTTIGADTATVVADLQDPKYGGTAVVVTIPTDGTTPVTVQLLTVVPPEIAGGQAGLAVQTVNVAV